MHAAPPEMSGGARRRPAVVQHRAKAAAAPGSVKVMEKDHKSFNSTMPATAIKASSDAALQVIRNRTQSRRDRKIALQQDVDKLRKKLRHEENVHRALERAFTRPLGALPRLPSYLPSQTLELLAEVAVLEEEVVRLEEQVVNFRQGLYEEAVIISMTKSAHVSNTEQCRPARHGQVSDQGDNCSSLKRVTNAKQTPKRPSPSLSQGDRPGKENQSCASNSCRDLSQSPVNNAPNCSVPEEEKFTGVQTVDTAKDHRGTVGTDAIGSEKLSTAANKVSEELLTCLLNIFSQARSSSDQEEKRSSSPSASGSCKNSDGACTGDPYGVLELESRGRDIGPYKQFRAVDATSFDHNVFDSNTVIGRRLKALLRNLSSVDLAGLSHQKLACWINTYNSCMMNAFLEHGVPTTPRMLIAMMPQAALQRIKACKILHRRVQDFTFSWYNCDDGLTGDLRAGLSTRESEGDEGRRRRCGGSGGGARSVWAGLARAVRDLRAVLRELVFAGVRVYTACHVEEELEAAKREYLQSAVGVSTASELSVSKLLHWYLLDFAKDVRSRPAAGARCTGRAVRVQVQVPAGHVVEL